MEQELYQACICGDYETLTRIIERGADVNTCCDESPLEKTTMQLTLLLDIKGLNKCIELLLDADAIITPVVRYNVARSGSVQTALILLNHGMNPVSFLFDAIKAKQLDMVKVALRYVSTVDVQSPSGSSPLMFACGVADMPIIEHLLDNGADVNHTNVYGQTALHFAAETGDPMCINLLLQKGANKNQKDDTGYSPAKVAELHGYKNLVQTLS